MLINQSLFHTTSRHQLVPHPGQDAIATVTVFTSCRRSMSTYISSMDLSFKVISEEYLVSPGLEFDGDTAAFCRCALPTGRCAFRAKQWSTA